MRPLHDDVGGKRRSLACSLCCVAWLACYQMFGDQQKIARYLRNSLRTEARIEIQEWEDASKPPEEHPLLSLMDNVGVVGDDGDDDVTRLCARVETSLDMRSWAPVRYHKDYADRSSDATYASGFNEDLVGSAREDDADARATIAEFNAVFRSDRPVLTTSLLDAGIAVGADRRALSFLRRMARSRNGTNGHRPVNIIVFGNSFASGAGCGESTVHLENHCAWPTRAKERMNQLLADGLGEHRPKDVAIDWHMWQEHSQGSIVIAGKVPTLVESFRSQNRTVDAILFDTSMTESWPHGAPYWFEAVLRAFLKFYPDALILSVISGLPAFVTDKKKKGEMLRDVRRKYQLTGVDLAKMVKLLHEGQYENNQTMRPPVDVLWPQSGDFTTDERGIQYWTNFVPRVRRKQRANFPYAHPQWPTHQHAADAIVQALLRTAHHACGLIKENRYREIPPSAVPEDTVSPNRTLVEACPICLTPLTSIDAKTPSPPSSESGESGVTTACGDWKWVTDERDRAGWQSDEPGSLLKIRVRMGAVDPLVVVTYTGSYQTFGQFRLTFRRPDWKPLLDCKALSQNLKTIPSITFSSVLKEYTLAKVATFPSTFNPLREHEFNLLNKTILSTTPTTPKAPAQDGEGQEVDIYIENTGNRNRRRAKIQMIAAC